MTYEIVCGGTVGQQRDFFINLRNIIMASENYSTFVIDSKINNQRHVGIINCNFGDYNLDIKEGVVIAEFESGEKQPFLEVILSRGINPIDQVLLEEIKENGFENYRVLNLGCCTDLAHAQAHATRATENAIRFGKTLYSGGIVKEKIQSTASVEEPTTNKLNSHSIAFEINGRHYNSILEYANEGGTSIQSTRKKLKKLGII